VKPQRKKEFLFFPQPSRPARRRLRQAGSVGFNLSFNPFATDSRSLDVSTPSDGARKFSLKASLFF
jgi:hypothetical protein